MTDDQHKRQFGHQHSYSDLMDRIQQPLASNTMISTSRMDVPQIRHSVSSNTIGIPANEQATKDVDPGRCSIFSPKPGKSSVKQVRKTTPTMVSKSNIKLVNSGAAHQNLVTTSSMSSSVNYANGSVTSRQQYLNANTGSNRST